MGKNKYKKQKIDTYVCAQDVERLEAIRGKYGFRSTYQLLQYLVYCFLRIADPDCDPIDDPIPSEIENMFLDNSEWEKHSHTSGSHADMNLKKKADQRKIKSANDIK